MDVNCSHRGALDPKIGGGALANFKLNSSQSAASINAAER